MRVFLNSNKTWIGARELTLREASIELGVSEAKLFLLLGEEKVIEIGETYVWTV